MKLIQALTSFLWKLGVKPRIVVRSGDEQTLQVFRTVSPCCNKTQVVFAMPTGDFELPLDEAIVCVSRL
jgi:hypothetical protein